MAAAFPSDIACITLQGYTQSLSKADKYVGDVNCCVRIQELTANIVIAKETDMVYFGAWFATVINFGKDVFTANLLYMGVQREWTVKITNDLSIDVLHADFRKIPVTFEIQDNVMDYLPATSYGRIFPTEISCPIFKGYKEIVINSSSNKYVNTCPNEQNYKAEVTVVLQSDDALAKLTSWYVNEVQCGLLTFEMDLPYLGDLATMTVQSTAFIESTMVNRNLTEVKMELIVQGVDYVLDVVHNNIPVVHNGIQVVVTV